MRRGSLLFSLQFKMLLFAQLAIQALWHLLAFFFSVFPECCFFDLIEFNLITFIEYSCPKLVFALCPEV